MALIFKTILHKKCRSGKNSEGSAENSYVQQNENKFQKVCRIPKIIRFFVLQVCHLRQTFKPTAESRIFVHIILQECKM